MSKAIYFAGVSRLNGELKFRTARSPARFQQLTKLGDTEVEMSSVNAESKEAAAQELLDRNFANGRADILALLTAVAGQVTKPKKVSKPKTVKIKNARIVTSNTAADDIQFSPKQAAKIRAEFMKKLNAAYEAN